MEKQELISVIVPVYKVEKYLSRCLDSLVSQTYKNIEIILVDDGSPDDSGEICDEYAKKDSRIKVIHKKNSGVSAARNLGVAESNGKYLVFVDSDDWVENNAIEVLYEKLIIENVDMVRGNYFINTDAVESIASTNTLIGENKRVLTNTDEFKNVILKSFLSGNIAGYLWLFMMKKELICNRNPFKEDIFLAEDLIFLIEIFSKAQSIYFLDVPHYHYYINENGLTRSAEYYHRNIKNMPKLTSYFEKIISNNWSDSNLINIRRAASTKMIMSYVYALFKQTDKKEFKKLLQQIFRDKDVSELLKNSDLKLLNQGMKKYIEIFFAKLLISKKYNLLILLYSLRKKLKF